MEDVKTLLFEEKAKEKTVKIEGESFIIRVITSRDRKDIAREMAIEQNGLPVNAFSPNDLYLFERDNTLRRCVVHGPAEWQKHTLDEYPYDEDKDQLFEEIQKWTSEYNQKLKKNRHETSGTK